jgi:hypothetical protein
MKSFKQICKLSKLYEVFEPKKVEKEKFISRGWILPDGKLIDLGDLLSKKGISHDSSLKKFPDLLGVPLGLKDYQEAQDLGLIRISAFDNQISFNGKELTKESLESLINWVNNYFNSGKEYLGNFDDDILTLDIEVGKNPEDFYERINSENKVLSIIRRSMNKEDKDLEQERVHNLILKFHDDF